MKQIIDFPCIPFAQLPTPLYKLENLSLTAGGPQSNHAMLAAACAGKLGMKSILVLKKTRGTHRWQPDPGRYLRRRGPLGGYRQL